MRRIMVFFLIIVLLIFVIPVLITCFLHSGSDKEVNDNALNGQNFTETFKISVYNTASDKLTEVEFEEYLVGVLAGEMPPTYDAEALKAQAVAARSYILSRVSEYLEGKVYEEHRGAMICTDYKHCKAWRDIAEVKSGWDVRFADDYEAKMRSAVELTKGEYMTYDNQVVKAYFYAMSSGRTEDVEEVWGTALPYLKSVPSREDIGSDGFESLNTYSKDEFIGRLKAAGAEVDISGIRNCIGEIQRTQGGGVARIEIGGKAFTGQEIRDMFELRSTNFEIITGGEQVVFKVKGYGHGVGMSQNGANVMAQEGKNYREILKHYYTGVSIVNLYKNI